MSDCNTCVYSYLLDENGRASQNPCKSCVDYDHYVQQAQTTGLYVDEMPCVEYPDPHDPDYQASADHDELDTEGE